MKGCFHPDNVGFSEPLKARTQCSVSTLLMCTLEETPIAFLTSLELHTARPKALSQTRLYSEHV